MKKKLIECDSYMTNTVMYFAIVYIKKYGLHTEDRIKEG